MPQEATVVPAEVQRDMAARSGHRERPPVHEQLAGGCRR